jgi:hypothetical protein
MPALIRPAVETALRPHSWQAVRAMHRSTGGRGVARAPFALLLLVLVTAACGDGRSSPAASAGPTEALASPASSQRLPTPVPTPLAPSAAPTPDATAAPAGRLLLRLTTCSHTCGSTAGTTFLDDGRLLWEVPDGSEQVLQARLSESGLAQVRAAIEATPALAADGQYKATLKPGAEPIAHGLQSFRFDVQWAAGPVVVTSWDPASLSDQTDRWTFPPEMTQLADLAARLSDPVAWLGADGFVGAPAPYVPTRVLVFIDLFPDVGDIGGLDADVDDVEWPFGQPIETAGEAIESDDVPAPRCLLLDAADAAALRDAEREAGSSRDPRFWETIVEYGWDRADGFVQVTVRQLLPQQTGPCAELLLDSSP